MSATSIDLFLFASTLASVSPVGSFGVRAAHSGHRAPKLSNLSRNERSQMVKKLDIAFGSSLDDKNASHIVLAAWAIKYGLTLPRYKSADEM